MIPTRAREDGPKEHRAKQKWPCVTYSVISAPGLSTHSYLFVTLPPPLFLCCPRPPSHHPSSLISVYLLPALHLLLLSTPFWEHEALPFLPHAQTISILSDPIYSLSIPALHCTYSFRTLSIRDTPTKLLKHFISRTFTFLLSALLIPHASTPYYAVGAITHL